MKILIVANNSGGLFRFRRMLMLELMKLGHSIIVSTPFDTNISDLQALGVKLIETPIDRRSVNPVKDICLFKTYIRILKAENPDYVITYTIKPNIYAGMACALNSIPYAVNITGLGTAFQNNGILKKVVCLLYKLGCAHANILFFENTDNCQTFLSEKIAEKEKTYCLHGAGVDLEHFQYSKYPSDSSIIKFLFIGRAMKEKGIEELLSAARKLYTEGYPIYLDVVGAYEEDYHQLFEKYAEEGWLRYSGVQEDVRPFISNAHCFVLPSWHEGMANTNLECAAMARPLITSNIPGCKEAVIPEVSGYLVEPKNTESLYNAMLRFAKLNNTERAAMGEAGRQHMVDVFDKKKVVAATVAALQFESE